MAEEVHKYKCCRQVERLSQALDLMMMTTCSFLSAMFELILRIYYQLEVMGPPKKKF
jgi:hypothetical protein